MIVTSSVSTPRRRFAYRALCVLACALAMSDASAGERRGMPHGAFAEARGARQAERAQQRAARIGQQRESAIQPRTVEPPQQPAGSPAEAGQQPGSRPGRLTLEERRALRQQIDEAGRDVYRPNRPNRP